MHNSFIRLLSSLIIACFLFIFIGWSTVSAFSTDAEPQSVILYVKPGSNGTCSSWADACGLGTAIYNAIVGDQIWVAAGTYKPTTDTNREIIFQLRSGIAIYGGFPAEGGEWSQRDWETNLTTISGDIGVVGYSGDNSFHVVTGNWADATAVLDGFIISGGNANGGPTYNNNKGGGMFNSSGSPTLTNVTFSGNAASGNSDTRGGGMYNYNSSPILSNVNFSGNTATGNDAQGGGMYNTDNSNPILTEVTFNGNTATSSGGGMANWNNSSPMLTNVAFSDNTTNFYGGGMVNVSNSNPTLTDVIFSSNTTINIGGGMFNSGSSPTLTDVTFSHNISDYLGGGMYNSGSSPTLINVTFNGNSATSYGGGMFNIYNSDSIISDVTFIGNSAESAGGIYNTENSNPTLSNVIFSGNTATNYGGGMYNSGSSNPTLTNVTFRNNTSSYLGGGMQNWGSSPTLTNVTFSGNSAYDGGGMHNWDSSPTLANSTFSNNVATDSGGGMYNNYNSSPIINNVTFSGNTATWSGGGMFSYEGSPSLSNSILWGNTPEQIDGLATITYSDVQGGYTGTGNIDADPLLNPLADNGGLTQTLALGAGSPAIDAGDPTNCPAIDQRGYHRPIDGDGDGTATCDMGAYEYASSPATFTLTLEIVGSGSITKDPDKSEYFWGEMITLTPVADPDWVFYGWGGDASGMDNPLTITIFEDTTITANFLLDSWTITLSVYPEGSGEVVKYPDQPTYHYGDQVRLTALPNPGWSFTGWTGGANGTENPLTVTVNENLEIMANFSQIEYSLSASVNPPGMGNVTKSPDEPYYNYGEVVTLTASSSITGWRFVGWTGNASGETNPLQITITANTDITANFSDQYGLTTIVEPIDSGTITRDIDQDTYSYGTQVSLTAIANPGWTFAGWSGDATGSDNPLTITILDDTSITATFTKDEYFLTVTPVGSGNVIVDPEQETYHYGDNVILTPTANPGWTFKGWSGDASGSDNPLTITILGDTSITATFTQNEYTLVVNVAPDGSGTVDVSPLQTTYHYGDEVTLTALAIPGWSFWGWGGDAAGSDNPLTYTILGDTSIRAAFTQDYYALTVTPIGSGSVVIDPVQATYSYGTEVTLTATADPGWTFFEWGGDAGGSINPLVITISVNTNITALFTTNWIFLPMITR